MKLNFLKRSVLLSGLIVSSFFLSCSDDDDAVATNQTIAQILSADSDYTSLVEALDLTNLTSTFTGTTNYTLFAPNNAAFQAVLDSNDSWNQLSDIPEATLTSILLNHVLNGEITSSEISTGYVNTLATFAENENISMYLNTTSGVVINGGSANGGATVDVADVSASNGVIHEVNSVIMLPTIVNFVLADDNFSTLREALTTATPNTAFETTLSGTGPFTVFAPTNAAFQALLDSNTDWNSLSDIGEETLTSVLQYHVANGNVRSGDLSNDQIVQTLLTDATFQIVIPGTNNAIADINDGTDTDKNITDVNIQASNGVIHVINGVLSPAS